MTRLIIVEGPDCSGKTTLAKALANGLNYNYVHMSGAPALHSAMAEYHAATLHSIEWTVGNVYGSGCVMDRSWPSEHVYGRLFRPHLVSRFPFVQQIDKIKTLRGIYIMCDSEEIVGLHNKEPDPSHHYDDGLFAAIVYEYRNLTTIMMMDGLPVIQYDRAKHLPQDFAKQVIKQCAANP